MAGLLIGNLGRRFAMSQQTRQHVDAFWSMIDEVLKAEFSSSTPLSAGTLCRRRIWSPRNCRHCWTINWVCASGSTTRSF